MYCVGLTGNIASGKSTVATYFARLGVDVISADEIAKELTTSKQPAFHEIISHFGESILMPSGELNRRYLRQLIFNDAPKRRWLEKLLHPLIRNRIKDKISHVKTPYCLIEIPLLTDRSHYPYLNRILVVEAEPDQLIARFMARDNATKEEMLAILATQADSGELHALADDILINSGSLTALQDNTMALHVNYLQYAALG